MIESENERIISLHREARLEALTIPVFIDRLVLFLLSLFLYCRSL